MEARLKVTLFWYKPSLLCYGNYSWKMLVSIRITWFTQQGREVCIKTRSPSASLPSTTVKWPIMMSLQLSDWHSVNYFKWHFIKSNTKKNTTSSEVYTTYRWVEWIHKSCKDGQVITFTRCQDIIGLTRDKSATTGLPKWGFSGPPKYAPCVGCRTSWGITL